MTTTKSKTASAQKTTAPKNVPTPSFNHVIAANEYGFYCIPRVFFGREVPGILRDGKVYEPDLLKFMRRKAGSGDIISGGAFVGDFFPALSQALAPDAKLHSFEPNPISFEAAQVTIALNTLENVSLSPVAVGDKSGVFHLQVSRGSGGASLAAGARIVDESAGDNTIEVKVVTLDDLIPKSRSVSILQLDIEGFEVPALMGALRILRDSRPIVIVEGFKGRDRRRYQEVFDTHVPDLKYELSGVIHRNSIYLPRG